MTKLVFHKYGVKVSRENVQKVLSILNLEGNERRMHKFIEKRIYHPAGKKYALHTDGIYKLKSLGFPIHGCKYCLSRKLM